jgi:hypothetical protein
MYPFASHPHLDPCVSSCVYWIARLPKQLTCHRIYRTTWHCRAIRFFELAFPVRASIESLSPPANNLPIPARLAALKGPQP